MMLSMTMITMMMMPMMVTMMMLSITMIAAGLDTGPGLCNLHSPSQQLTGEESSLSPGEDDHNAEGEEEEEDDHNAEDDFDRGVKNALLTLMSLRV